MSIDLLMVRCRRLARSYSMILKSPLRDAINQVMADIVSAGGEYLSAVRARDRVDCTPGPCHEPVDAGNLYLNTHFDGLMKLQQWCGTTGTKERHWSSLATASSWW
jgi:hypothetical protein